ncbi:MAG TPA: efflux RND transporter periplasmic adaptor subunit [Gemmataceae bacterium]|nr:efflux RND transporter periplasmic adaptor subunit [Gemmataceae bacterium]
MDDRALSRLLREIRDAAGDGVGDAELLARFAATGDEAAFELLVRRHQRLVFGVCRRVLNDHHDAEDAFQATFLALARKARGIGKRQAVAGWLFRVAYRAALAARAGRARRTSRERPVAAAESAAAPADPAALPEQREAWAAVDEEVSRLPERFRAAAVLCYLEGKTVDEAARLLGCPRGTVASRLARARARLHRRLSRRGVGLAVAAPAVEGFPTVSTAVLDATSKAAGRGVSPTAAALAREVLQAMFWKKITTGAAALAAVLGVLLIGGLTVWMRASAAVPAAGNPPAAKAAAPDKDAAATAVTVSRPVRREFTPFEDLTGQLERPEPVPIVARVSGRLLDPPHVTTNDEVKKGDLIWEIDPAPLKAALAKAEAALDAAPGPDRAAAKAAVERARQDLEGARIVAPADGVIHQLWRPGPGDTVGASWESPVVLGNMLRPRTMGVLFEMDERSYLRFRRLLAGREVQAENGLLHIGLTDEEGFPHEGMIARFMDQFNAKTGTIDVHGVFPDPDRLLLPGMFARVRLPMGKPAPALLIAEEAVFADQGKHYVWVVGDHNAAERRELELGQHDGDLIVVKEGLSPDDWVVVAGGKDLHAGDKVEPSRTAMPGSKNE